MSAPTPLIEIELLRELRAIDERLTKIEAHLERVAPQQMRALWTPEEFAAFVPMSAESLAKPKYWRRFGGKKIGGRVYFPESVRLALAHGERV